MRIWEKVIEGLKRYHFLTYRQLINLGVGTTNSNLSPILRGLIKDGYVHEWRRPTYESFFHLSHKGAKRFGGCGRKKYKKRPLEIDHRLRTVDVEILLSEHNLKFCSKYYDPGKKTNIPLIGKSFEPDLIGIIKTSKQEELYLVEVEQGVDLKKITQKIELHVLALKVGAIPNHLEFKRGYRVLLVVEHKNILERVLKKVQEDTKSNFRENFLISNDLQNWYNLVGKERKLYYT
ncbi:hypothetical protein FUA23_16465 [Neolewinella aurantiaca]|uniref:Uncharacterized protein n=1 Tax=Neolewinella aurantiaca TaxID=2602767 RepID=A0A5C7FTF3_9BACT|nr:hypothetical protein [Neolewinella aurantiaca]TXF88073.1 hypothetical protein FUA23_16465 [Neolewinella aurantiaca]